MLFYLILFFTHYFIIIILFSHFAYNNSYQIVAIIYEINVEIHNTWMKILKETFKIMFNYV